MEASWAVAARACWGGLAAYNNGHRCDLSTVWLTLEQFQLVAILLLFGAGPLLRKSL